MAQENEKVEMGFCGNRKVISVSNSWNATSGVPRRYSIFDPHVSFAFQRVQVFS